MYTIIKRAIDIDMQPISSPYTILVEISSLVREQAICTKTWVPVEKHSFSVSGSKTVSFLNSLLSKPPKWKDFYPSAAWSLSKIRSVFKYSLQLKGSTNAALLQKLLCFWPRLMMPIWRTGNPVVWPISCVLRVPVGQAKFKMAPLTF